MEDKKDEKIYDIVCDIGQGRYPWDHKITNLITNIDWLTLTLMV